MFCFCLYAVGFYANFIIVSTLHLVMYHIAPSWIVHYPN